MIRILKEDIQVLNQRLNLIRAEPDKIEYFISLDKKKLIIKEDELSDRPFSEEPGATSPLLNLNSSLDSIKSASFATLPEKQDYCAKIFEFQK